MISEPAAAASPAPALRILVAVCTYNEAENIRTMLGSLREFVPQADLLVVDDDSPDGTAAIVRELQPSQPSPSSPTIHLIVRSGQRGLGLAIKRAIEFATQGDYDLFVNLDGDLSHQPAQVPRLLAPFTTQPHMQLPDGPTQHGPTQHGQLKHNQTPQPDVVVGSRYLPGGEIIGWPRRRRIMSRIVNRFATLFLRLPVSDCSGSMRCYRVSALQRISLPALRSDGYALLEELLVALARSGARLTEVPITFIDRERGKSKLTVTEAMRSALQIFLLAFRSDLKA